MSRKTVVTGITLIAVGLVGANPSVQAKGYTLPELVEMARKSNPGIMAGGAAVSAMESQANEARRNWWPSGELLSFVTAVPKISCQDRFMQHTDAAGNELGVETRESTCITTNANPRDNPGNFLTKLAGVWSRTELKLVQPIFDFGKISAGVEAAEAGAVALRARQNGMAYDVELNVKKAYWGLKLAREILDALDEGSGYIGEAQKKLDKELEAGTGNATVTDKLRLRTVRAEIDARTLETRRLAGFALNGLRTLTGAEAPGDLDVDDEPFEAIEVPKRPVTYYEEQARLSRPEVRALEYGLKAKHALSDLERRREYPDLVLIGTAVFAYAPTIDTPKNTFMNNPFNTLGAGIAAALRVPLDLGPKFARSDRVNSEAAEFDFRRREALGGIALEVQKAYGEVSEAVDRVETLHKGERAGKSWVTAVAQNFAIGLAEARDFSDALNSFFLMRVRYLQSIYDLNVAVAALSRATGAAVP